MRWVVGGIALACLAFADGPLSPADQARTIEQARRIALEYSGTLPNFLCTETVERFIDLKGNGKWKHQDTLTVGVGFSEQHELYRLLAVDGKPTKKALENLPGFKSRGEFRNLLHSIFVPDSETEFRWTRSEVLRDRQVQVFAYHIDGEHSSLSIRAGGRSGVRRGILGEVWIDQESGQAWRVTMDVDGTPGTTPDGAVIERNPGVLDYDFYEIGGQRFLLPSRVELTVITDRGRSRNVMAFRDYRKFSSDATITFDKQP